MLRTNLATEMGLVNGAIGEVVDFIFSSDYFDGRLPVTLVWFPRTTCATFAQCSKAGGAVVPIAPVTRERGDASGELSRTQLPLTLAYAMTVHKSQGLTLGKSVVELGCSERYAGLTYTALSRVATLASLAIAGKIDMERLEMVGSGKRLAEWRRRDEWRARNTEPIKEWLLRHKVPPLDHGAQFDRMAAGRRSNLPGLGVGGRS